MGRGLFTPPPIVSTADAKSWEYDTMSQHGNAWGIGYRLAAPPTSRVALVRRGQTLTGLGSAGAELRISGGAADWDATGAGRPECTLDLKLPFSVQLPTGC